MCAWRTILLKENCTILFFIINVYKVIYTCTNVHEHQYQSHDTKKGPRSSSSNKLSIKEKYPTTASKVVYLCIFVSASNIICFVPTVFNLHRKKIKNNRLCGAWNILFLISFISFFRRNIFDVRLACSHNEYGWKWLVSNYMDGEG